MLILAAIVMIFFIATLVVAIKYSNSPMQSVLLLIGPVFFVCSIFLLIFSIVGIVLKNNNAFDFLIISIIGLIFGITIKFLTKNSTIRS
ncbi:MAG: hypothetical protein IOC63_06190 [Methylobacterium sp.]|nr:hypothetical protein [Methylobacterium sp.]